MTALRYLPAAMVMSCLLISCAAAEAAKGWTIKIEHRDGVRHRVSAWRDGWRVEDGTTTSIYLAGRPLPVLVISEENEAYGAITFDRFLGLMVPPMVPKGTSFVIGKPTRVRENGMSLLCYPGYEKGTSKLLFKIWAMPDVCCAEGEATACETARIPLVRGFPVRADVVTKGKLTPFIKLISVEHKEIDLSVLRRLKSFQKVATPLELTFCQRKKPLSERDLDSIFFVPSSRLKGKSQ